MMSDVVLQVLLILAYLAIGLVAVTFPIYAICVTYLPQEKWESEKNQKKRIEKLRTKISDLTAQLKGEKQDSDQVAQLKDQIDRYSTEIKGTELRVDYLTAKGAVRVPLSYLALSLLAVGIGIYFFNQEYLEGVIAFGLISGLLSNMAIYRLYKTISAVEYAALRPARTIDFSNIGFGRKGEKTKRIKLNKETEMLILAGTFEDDLENFMMCVTFPSEIEMSSETASQDLDISKYPEYTVITNCAAFVPRGMSFGVICSGIPKKTGKYAVEVRIMAKGIYEVRRDLTLIIVK